MTSASDFGMSVPMRKTLLLVLLASGCGGASTPATTPVDEAQASSERRIDPLLVALDNPARTEEDRARDAARHPRETLQFFGLEETMDVVELSPGGGWYTRILAPYLAEKGSLTVGLPDGRYGDAFRELAAQDPELYGKVRQARFAPPEGVEIADESADLVLTFRNVHGWMRAGVDGDVFRAVFRVLRPGGVFGVVQHRDEEGGELRPDSGYVPESYVIRLAEEAGFVLEAKSDINANPRDTRDHENGVWSLPPSLRVSDEHRDRMVEIGESDRMTLKFRKPAH